MLLQQNMHGIREVATKLALAAALLCLTCAQAARAQSASADEDAIREAVARYQIAKWDLKAEIYFLSIEGKNPSDALLKRLADVNPPVQKKSLSKKTKDAVGAIVEAKTEKIGVIFDQQAIRRSGEGKADVAGGYYCGNLCSGTGIYRLQLRDGHWVVTGFEPGA
jgi:hypothetical protein